MEHQNSERTRRRRSVLSVPASEPGKIAKAYGSIADEVVVDLEDSVALGAKDVARAQITLLERRTQGSVAVRVNAVSTPWFEADVTASVTNPAVTSIVVPKVESPDDLRAVEQIVRGLEKGTGRDTLGIQALIESARGLSGVAEISRSSSRLVALILGYADLAASLGRAVTANWQVAQDLVVLAARTAGIQAIDGPHLSVAADDVFTRRVANSNDLGFDGTWVIHPQQLPAAQQAFTPDAQAVADAREIIAVMTAAAADGHGAVSWRGRMLDEALVVSARRLISRVDD